MTLPESALYAIPTVAASLAAAELFVRLPLIPSLRDMQHLMRKSTAAMNRKGVSDHWKERALPAYSARLMAASLRLLLCFAVVLGVFVIVAIVIGRVIDAPDALSRAASWPHILLSIIAAGGYIRLFRRGPRV